MEDWRRRLIDLSYRNRLIKYRPLRASSLEIVGPRLERLLADPGRSTPFNFYFPPDPDENGIEEGTTQAERMVDRAVLAKAQSTRVPRPDEIVLSEPHPKRINRTLENLARKSNAEFQDKALRVLYIAAGFLEWTDPARDEHLRSPLVLVPVRLHRQSASSPYQLFFVDDEEPVINPSLTEKLRHDANLELPEDFAWEDKPILTELSEIESAVTKYGWSVHHDAVLGLFSFQKYVMYRDLLDNESKIVKHPLVRSLAEQRLTSDARVRAAVPELAELDEEQPATETFSILDADGSQRRCIEAAKRGESFVMHGPPGTGKSQTIANIIAEAIAQGQKVLFVSEKAAALDVVHNRLRERSLDDFCLMLHGEHANRREVVAALNSSLTTELVPRLALSDVDLSRHDNLRRYLNEQVATLHSPEPILGDQAIREVYARLATLHDAVSVHGAPGASRAVGADVIGEIEKLRDVFGRLAERWSVTAPDYVWREFDQSRFSSDDRARVAHTVMQLRAAAVTLSQTAEISAGRLGWPEPCRIRELEPLAAISEHLREAPPMLAEWLDIEKPSEVRSAAIAAERAYDTQQQGIRELARTYPRRPLEDFRADCADLLERAAQALIDAGGATPGFKRDLLAGLPDLVDAVEILPGRRERAEQRLGELCVMLGQPDDGASFARLDQLVRLGRLTFDPAARPEADWLVQAGLDRAIKALADAHAPLDQYQRQRDAIFTEWSNGIVAADTRRLSERACALSARRDELLKEWTVPALAVDTVQATADWEASEAERTALQKGWSMAALDEDAAEIAQRFREEHTSALARLKGAYRRDAKLVKSRREDGRLPLDPAAELARLAEWQRTRKAIVETIHGFRADGELPDDMLGKLAAIGSLQNDSAAFEREICALRLRGDMPPDLVPQLAKVAELQTLGALIDEHGPRWSIAFGSYWNGRDTNPSLIAAACQAGAEALELRHADTDIGALAAMLCEGAIADPHLAQAADQLESSVSAVLETMGRIEPFAASARIDREATTLKSVDHLAARIAQPVHNLHQVVEDLQRGAIEPAPDLIELQQRATMVSELHRAQATIAESERGWAATIGPAFQAAGTDWSSLELAAQWLEELFRLVPSPTARIREQLIAPEIAQWPDPERIRVATDTYLESAGELAALFAEWRRAQIIDTAETDELPEVERWCDELLAAVDTLYDWTDFRHYRDRAREAGWDAFVQHMIDASIGSEEVSPAFERAFWGRRLDALFNEEPELEEDFRGGSYQRFISDFQQLDGQLIRTGPDRLIARRNTTSPRRIAITNSEVAILKTEAGKIRRHKPVRQLLAEIPTLLMELKPCLMMSPLSVSHYLTTAHRFDLVLFDEASQVPPQDAINCVYRGTQLIVAGDSRQLPPTSFFQVAEVGDSEQDEDADQEDMESILDSCQALLPEHYLRWHYRSRHEDLIAFSNREIYDDELLTFPTPDHISAEMGVTFNYVPDGVYDRGKTQTNTVEAQAVARRLVECLRDGSGRSVGVIAFNAAQAGAISNELDLLRVQDPAIDAYFGGDRLDGPFVKHLESVQGDERDVILFSVGYGRDAEGKFSMNFGPLNKSGGHRRLNVAVTRARQKVELFAGVRSTDFELSDRASRGARLLREYLAYAERSDRHANLEALGDADHLAVSGIEREIAREIRALGYPVIHQLGAGSTRIDLAVIDPESTERFILAIESDGTPYRNTPTARDRDRLRDQVLRDLGWRVHRVWSLDWVRDRAGQTRRLQKALEHARQQSSGPPTPVEGAIAEGSPRRVNRTVVELRDRASILELPWVAPYARAALAHQHSAFEFHDAGNRAQQRELARQLIEVEAPVHTDYVIRRLADAYGLQRVGNRVDAAARQALSQTMRSNGYIRRGKFIWRAGQALDVVRRPLDGDPRTRREIELIAPEELDLAFNRLLEGANGVSDDDLIAAAARIVGFDRTGERVRAVLERRLRAVRRDATKKP
jgi:very-short-patch-repair endonuclease